MKYKAIDLTKKIILIVCSTFILLTSAILCIENLVMQKQKEKMAEKPAIETEISQMGLTSKELEKSETIRDFNWIKDLNSSIGTITIEDSGRKVNMTGNQTLPGKNAIYIIPTNHQEQTFTFTYSIDYGDSFIAAGVLLKVKKENNYLKGYMLSFNHSEDTIESGKIYYTEANNHLGAIWQFSYQLENNLNNTITRTLVKPLDIPVTGTMTVKSTSEQIILTGTDINETLNIGEGEDVGDGFGFFSVHYEHNCDRIGGFALENFAVTTVDILPHSLFVDPNGGIWQNTSAVTEIKGIYRDIQDIPVPTRPGYTFVGWTKTGNSGTMSSLTGNAVYTFGEDEETNDYITAQWVKIDVSKKSDNAKGDVVVEEEVTYTITATNSGTVAGTAIIKDSVPTGTTFVANSIQVNGAATQNTEQDLNNGITLSEIPANSSATVSFKVKVNDLNNGDLINNTAKLKDITVSTNAEEKESNNVQLRYIEPIISQTKTQVTQNQKDYVVNGEKITYTISISNDGFLGKDVAIKDTIPTGTTFVEGSIKVNGGKCIKPDGTPLTASDLANGLSLNIPAETKNQTLSFEVTVNDIENEQIIENVASVDEKPTNIVYNRYIEPIISQRKEATTEYEKDYVVNGEKITYSIIVENDGSLEKNAIIKDTIPTGTTFVEGSIKVNGGKCIKPDGTPLTASDLANGLSLNIPAETKNQTLSFEVTVNDIENEQIIENVASVDEKPTNIVYNRYIEPIISQRKEAITEYEKDYVVNGEKITYSIIVENDGSLEKNAIIKDIIPTGTTFVEGSIKVNGELYLRQNEPIGEQNGLENQVVDESVENHFYNSQNLAEGIEILVPAKTKKKEVIEGEENNYIPGKTVLSFEVAVNDIENEQIIENVASVDEKPTNIVYNRYIEPIISQRKEAITEYEKDYVVNGEKITYSIIVENDGSLEKNAIIKDIIPTGTTFVEGSIKVNGELYLRQNEPMGEQNGLENQVVDESVENHFYNSQNLAEGIEILVPAKTKKKEVIEGEENNYIPGKTVLSFEVTVNDIENEQIIENVASVDEKPTNIVYNRYIEPIISQRKEAITEYEKDYVAEGEKITYNIIVENDGSLEKKVIIKDVIPTGTTFVEGSIKVNGEDNITNKLYHSEDLEKGIEVFVPAKVDIEYDQGESDDKTEEGENKNKDDEMIPEEPEKKKYLAGKTRLSFEVIVDKLEEGIETAKIINIAAVDEIETNEVEHTVLPFNMKIEKQIESFMLNGKEQLGKDKKLMKAEIVGSEVSKTTTKITYSIVVTNTGKIEGTATIIDDIPEGYEVENSNPSYWIETSDGKLETTTEKLAPGVSKKLKVVLKWKNAKDNFGPKVNKAEITKTENDSNAKERTLEDNISEATVVMGIKTGTIKDIAFIIVIVISGMILIAGIVLIKKLV